MPGLAVRLAVGLAALGWGAAVAANDRDSADRGFAIFRAHDESSAVKIDYQVWGYILSHTLWIAGPSSRHIYRIRHHSTGTRISLVNPNRSWLEGNRVFFHLLEDSNIEGVSAFRRELEALPDQYPLASMSRREQLAFWINLYNVTVYEQVALRYPVVKLFSLRGGPGGGGLWDQKLLTVAGVPLSLNDIQNNILIPIWQSPLVLYGLFQGAVGGPNLRRRAYDGANVWNSLRKNAKEFVNSIRGVHRHRNLVRISRIYDWGRSAFPDWEPDVRRHLLAFADDETRAIITEAEGIEASYYDWYIADLYNGRPSHISTYPGRVWRRDDVLGMRDLGFPEHVRAYLDRLRLKFERLGISRGRVTIEDIVTEDKDRDRTDDGH